MHFLCSHGTSWMSPHFPRLYFYILLQMPVPINNTLHILSSKQTPHSICNWHVCLVWAGHAIGGFLWLIVTAIADIILPPDFGHPPDFLLFLPCWCGYTLNLLMGIPNYILFPLRSLDIWYHLHLLMCEHCNHVQWGSVFALNFLLCPRIWVPNFLVVIIFIFLSVVN